MRRFPVRGCLGVLLLLPAALPTAAQPTASALVPITSPDYLPSSDPPAIGADSTGRVMVVYLGRGSDNQWKFFSVLQSSGGWQQAPLPMPAGATGFSGLTARQVTAREPGGGYHFVGSYSGKVYYWHWQGGTWSSPELVTDDGSSGTALALDAAGQPVIARSSTRFRYYHKVQGQWQEIRLSTALWQQSLPSVVSGASGVPHLLGIYRRVPIVATPPTDADPAVENNWVITPTGDREAWTSGVPSSASTCKFALDWVRQRVYAAYLEQKNSPRLRRLHVLWAPVGATAASQWQSASVDLPDRAAIHQDSYRLVSNGYGHVALAYQYTLDGDPTLRFRWLGASGPGPEVEVVRPGTPTEACVFSTISTGSLNVDLHPSGIAHLVVKAVKRGEVPANKERLFYATVSGGGTGSPQEPGGGATTGGTTAGGEPESPKPDFLVSIASPASGTTVRLTTESLHPRVAITNQGAQYFGDLWLEADIDGAKVRVHIPDLSGHRQPLFTRGQKRDIYLPTVVFSRTPDPQYPPSAVTYEYPFSNKRVTTATGLGRKQISVVVDPDNRIEEAVEDNNSARVEYIVYDGANKADQDKGPDGKTRYGLNDLAFARPPQLKSNTPLWRAGYLQRPTSLQVVVSNPRLASFFQNAEVVLLLDGREIARQTIPVLDKQLNLWSGALTHTVIYGGAPPKPDFSGAILDFPVDLSEVTEGNHTLKVVVDPEDKFADRYRGNNVAEINFKVRGPGGTLRVQVVDKDDGTTPVTGAFVALRDLWAKLTDARGLLEIPDVPPGDYDAKAVSADRTGNDPRYYPAFAPPFSIAANQTTTVILPLEKAVVIVGDVYDNSTGALLTADTVGVSLEDSDFYHPTYVNGPRYQIFDVPPGQQTIRAGAYSYLPTQVTQEVHRGPQGQCRVDLRLQPGPRANIEGTVLDEATNRPLAGADVWLNGAPRSTSTDAQGRFRLERVAANADYQILATAKNYTLESADTGRLAEGQTKVLPPLKLARISSRVASLDFHAITWADFEETSTGRGQFKVRLKYGQFDTSLAMLYRTTSGRGGLDVDQVIVGITPGPWCESRVSTYAAPSIVCVALLEAKAAAGDVANGNLLAVGQRIKSVYDYATGDFDPAQLGTGGTVVGSFTSQSGNKYTPEISILGLPVSEGLWGFTATDGTTTVRVDKVEVTDGTTTKTVPQQWFSPSMAVYQIGKHFDQDKLEVRLYLKVMNQNLSVGPLYASAENVITWKPLENKWARMDPRPY